MEEIVLEAQLREEIGRGKVKAVRDTGFTPGIVYGEEKLALAVKFSHRELTRLAHEHRLENSIIKLKIKNDLKPNRSCLVKEIQYHPVRGNIIHLDFNEISLTEVIKINVPVVAQGDPVGVKNDGGSLEHILWEVEVECLPVDIPKEIIVDVSALKIGEVIHIKDIKFSDKVKVLNEPDVVVLSVAAPIKEEAPAAAVEGEEKQEPEVIKEKKEVPAEGEEAKLKEEKK